MLVKEVMSKKPFYLDPHTTLQKAAVEMSKHDCGIVPIGDGEKLLGMVTDRDITLRAVAEGWDPTHTELKDIMSKHVLYCFEDDDITKAVDSMSDNRIRRLIVLNKNKRLTGVVSIGDIAIKATDPKLLAKLIKAVSQHIH
jgi:CBS domain-containing protein